MGKQEKASAIQVWGSEFKSSESRRIQLCDWNICDPALLWKDGRLDLFYLSFIFFFILYLFVYNYAHIHADAWGGQKKISYPLWLDEVKGNMDAGSQTRSPASAAITLNLWSISAALHKTFLIPMSSQLIFHCHVTFSQPQSLSYWSKPCVSISVQFWSS